MKQTKFKILTTSCALAVLLAACGGGGGSGSGGTNGDTFVGTITSFGSVTVGGVKFETDDDTEIEVEDEAHDESELEVGQRVVIRGTDNGDGTGTAHSIKYDDNLEGIVTVDLSGAGTGIMTIMGQDVKITVTTVVESDVDGLTISSAADITAGMIVEVSGLPTAEGEITATFIEVKGANLTDYLAAGGELEMKGTISDLSPDTDPKTFIVNGITVVYDDSTILDDISNEGLVDGLFVEVKTESGLDDEGRFIATKIEAEDDHANDHGDDDDEVEFDGEITTAWEEGATSIGVNGIEILLTETTELEGLGYDGLTEGRRVEVEVSIVDGVYTALEIEAEHDDVEYLKAYGIAASVDMTEEDTLAERNVGTVTIGDDEFTINPDTIMEDDVNDSDTHFNLTDLNAGDSVEIYYVIKVTGEGETAIRENVAVKLERYVPGTESDTED